MNDELMHNQPHRPKKVIAYAFYVGLIALFLLVAYVGIQQCCLMKY
jgi:hypothetical protein